MNTAGEARARRRGGRSQGSRGRSGRSASEAAGRWSWGKRERNDPIPRRCAQREPTSEVTTEPKPSRGRNSYAARRSRRRAQREPGGGPRLMPVQDPVPTKKPRPSLPHQSGLPSMCWVHPGSRRGRGLRSKHSAEKGAEPKLGPLFEDVCEAPSAPPGPGMNLSTCPPDHPGQRRRRWPPRSWCPSARRRR